MAWTEGSPHLPDCAVGSWTKNDFVCYTGKPHRWSGWPGAYCQDCFVTDPGEVCMGGCKCPCHDEFWAEYAKSEAYPQSEERDITITKVFIFRRRKSND